MLQDVNPRKRHVFVATNAGMVPHFGKLIDTCMRIHASILWHCTVTDAENICTGTILDAPPPLPPLSFFFSFVFFDCWHSTAGSQHKFTHVLYCPIKMNAHFNRLCVWFLMALRCPCYSFCVDVLICVLIIGYVS